MSNTDIETLIEKLCAGKCSKAEMEQVLDHIQAHPDEKYEAVMTLLWKTKVQLSKPTQEESERILKRTLSTLKAQEGENRNDSPLFQVKADPKGRRWWIGSGIAAAIALLLWLGLWYLKPVTSHLITVTTAFAEQQTITLPDGSTVELNANSSISFPEKWDDAENRVVRLTGEAFFQVTKKEVTGQKFYVLTDDLVVEVLGTTFNVNTHHDETKVFLEEGKVKLNFESSQEPILMQPGDMVAYSQKTKVPRKIKSEPKEPISWRAGYVKLPNANLKEILQKVNEIYGLDYEIVNPNHPTTTFTIHIPIDNYETMFAALEQLTGLTIKRKGDKLIVE